MEVSCMASVVLPGLRGTAYDDSPRTPRFTGRPFDTSIRRLRRVGKGLACFGPGFSGRFVLSALENISTALTCRSVKLRLIKTCPCSGTIYSHLRPRRLHLEHSGRERSHYPISSENARIAEGQGHSYLNLHVLTNGAAT